MRFRSILAALVLGAATLAAQTPVPTASAPLMVGPWAPVVNVKSMPTGSGCLNAKGNAVNDDAPSINCAINYAIGLINSSGSFGAVVQLPCGDYVARSTIQIPPMLGGTVVLRGGGMRCTYIYPTGATTNFTTTGTQAVPSTFIMGAATPDPAGTFTNVSQYVGWEDLSISGSLLTGGGNVRAVVITECQYCWIRNAIIESYPNSSTGLYLLGATVTGGLGANVTAPHVRLCRFENIVVTTIGTGASSTPKAMVIQNGDENDFYNSSFATTTGLTPGADAILTVKIELGRNNRFFGVLYSGDVGAGKTNYVGLKLGPPVNEAGVANGSVVQNQDYGAVAEGFDRTFWFGGDNSGNTLGNAVLFANPSIFNTAYLDDNPALTNGGFSGGGNGGNIFWAPLLNIMYGAIASTSGPAGLFADGATTPSVGGADVWRTQNSAPTTVLSFLAATGASLVGRTLTLICADVNTTIRDVNNGGGGNIRNWGRQDLSCKTDNVVSYVNAGGIWYQSSPLVAITNTAGQVFYSALAYRSTALTCGSATTPALDASLSSNYTCNITSNVAVVVAIPTNAPAAGQSERIVISLRNSSGGALTTAPTLNTGAGGFKFTGTCNPANGTQCVWTFAWDPVQSFWYQVGGTPTGL